MPSSGDQVHSLTAHDGNVYSLYPHVFWYLAPARTDYRASDRNVGPLDFALLLHNAVMGQGVVPSMDVLLSGTSQDTPRTGTAREAELTLERVRAAEFAALPSRMRCHFLSYCEQVARRRQDTMFRSPPRRLVRCQLLGAGRAHFADVDLYERLQGQPADEALALRYWEGFTPSTVEEFERLEVLTSTALYFPDWATFPTVDTASLVDWQAHHPPHGST
jgi:hypothetical protein